MVCSTRIKSKTMSSLEEVHKQPEWAWAKPIAANPLPFSPVCTPPRNFLQPYADPPHAGCPAEYITAMYPHPENTIGPCPYQKPTPCVQQCLPCNIQPPPPPNNALQCCAPVQRPNYGSSVYYQQASVNPNASSSNSQQQQQPPQQPQTPSHMYRQESLIDTSLAYLLKKQNEYLRIIQWTLIALAVLVFMGVVLIKRS